MSRQVTSDRVEEDVPWHLRPCFIAGAARSGTTLLLSLLDGHPELVVYPMETSILGKSFRTPEAEIESTLCSERLFESGEEQFLVDAERLARRNEDLRISGGYTGVLTWDAGCRREFIADYLQACAELRELPIPARVYSALAMTFEKRLGLGRNRRGFVEKTPFKNGLWADTLLHQFPEGKIIHVIRDPRTRYASRKALLLPQGRAAKWMRRHVPGFVRFFVLWPRTPNAMFRDRFDFATELAVTSRLDLELAQRNKTKFGERYKVIRYEDLAANPATVMREVAGFLGIEESGGLTRRTTGGLPKTDGSSFGRDDLVAVVDTHKDRLGRYEALTNTAERAWVESIWRGANQRFYRMSGDRSEKLRLLPFRFESVTDYLRSRPRLLKAQALESRYSICAAKQRFIKGEKVGH